MGLTLRQLRLRAVWLLIIPFFLFSTPTRRGILTGIVLALVGLGIRAWSAGTILKDQSLTTGGPYAFTRNPLYLGSFAMGIGVTFAGGHWMWPVLFLGFFTVVYGRTISEESHRLAELFPARYPHYRSAVPAFVPRVTPWRGMTPPGEKHDGGAFRWSQYFAHREWEALLGVIAAFALLSAKVLFSAA